MGLSRLDNFLKNARGNILYVNPNDLDSTDSIENQGNSLTRPFKTIQRALIEAARFSYQRGLNNDRFGQTTILLYPGEHLVDNRPGWIPINNAGTVRFRKRDGLESGDFNSFDSTTNFDLTTDNNALYKLNSIHGGVILPRGTSLVGLDLRKTKIRPKYVPDPENDNIERSAIFRVTGSCYLWQFSLFDGDPNGVIYKDYTNNLHVPNFSHHKLTCFEYADGVNPVVINDIFTSGGFSSQSTDLDMYYQKIGIAYGPSSGRTIENDFPSSGVDIQAKVDEYRIVGSLGASAGIASIRSGDGGLNPSTTITVTTSEPIRGLQVDTPIQISGFTPTAGYNGQYVVSEILTDTQFQYQLQNVPSNPLPSVSGATVNLTSDTVTSSSPYIFNISMRSVWGMCGLHADGNKADGFKSMVVAQFTGIGLQKDDRAFLKYDTAAGRYTDSTVATNVNLHSDSLAVYKPSYTNYHIKASNNAFLQLVSVFAIGYAAHFIAESGGDHSITNSNSNFGAKSLVATGFRDDAFEKDDVGYITHIIPPKELETNEIGVEFVSFDVQRTISIGNSSRLYLFNETNADTPPSTIIDGYRLGAAPRDTLNVVLGNQTFNSVVVMQNPTTVSTPQSSYIKSFQIGRTSGINSITSNVITLTQPHTFQDGESIRILSSDSSLPDGIESNQIYYAIASQTGLGTDQIRLAQSKNDAISFRSISLNNKGGTLTIQSRVSDKNPGETGHPVQYDTGNNQWYVNVSSASTENLIYTTIVGLGTTALGTSTPRSYFIRRPDNRSIADTVYKIRYVIPAGSGIERARPPIDGYIIQESSDTGAFNDTESAKYFGVLDTTLSSPTELRNCKFISNASWNSANQTAFIDTELPHELKVGNNVEIVSIASTINPTGVANSGFNGTYNVIGISSAKQFSVRLNVNPGQFSNNTSSRTASLPRIIRKEFGGVYQIYRSQEVQQYIAEKQDGIYHLLVTNSSNSPDSQKAPEFSHLKFSQPIQYFYPQSNRDNPLSDPKASISYASPSPIGQVVIDDLQNSITKETIENKLIDFNIGVGITNVFTNATGTAVTFATSIDHGLNRITRVSIANSGSGYGTGLANETFYNARLVGISATLPGAHATARVTVASGNIIDVKILDGGSAYGVGTSLSVVGIATTTGHTIGIVSVTNIYNNIGDTLKLEKVNDVTLNGLNGYYRIDNVISDRLIAATPIFGALGIANTLGFGATSFANSNLILTGSTLNVTSINYSQTSGIATFVTTQNHGLNVDNKVIVSGATESLYNGSKIVKRVNNLTTFEVNLGIGTVTPVVSGTIRLHNPGYVSYGGDVKLDDENIGGRLIPHYGNITTTLQSAITTPTNEVFSIDNLPSLDFNIGDYLLIDDEILRIRRTINNNSPSPNEVTAFRGVLGTRPGIHTVGSVIKRIKPKPVEFRRNSIIRASGHTFEYVGFGPGNYSTSLPDRQDREISAQEEILSQSTKVSGGIIVYTGMNNDGDFYIGNKKVSSATGQEEVFDSPIPSFTGEDISATGINIGFDVLTPLEATISRALRVEGGPDNNIVSEFDGPVVFTNKITSTSTKGIEASSLYLQGDAIVSRRYTVGISTPTIPGTPGDIVYNANPFLGDTIGWVYTSNNAWARYGNVSSSSTSVVPLFDGVGIGTTVARVPLHVVGVGSTALLVEGNARVTGAFAIGPASIILDGTNNIIGAGTGALIHGNNNIFTSVNNQVTIGSSVRIDGSAGIITANRFVGDGSQLTNLPNDSLWGFANVGLTSDSIYPFELRNVGIGTSLPRFSLEVGTVGSAVTGLWVNNDSRFIGSVNFNSSVSIQGQFIATNFSLNNSSSNILSGIVTANQLYVGVGLTGIVVDSNLNVGIGTSVPRSKLDIEGRTRFKTYYETTRSITGTGVVDLDLSDAQTFAITPSANITGFRILNPPPGNTAFTLLIIQGTTPRTVNVDTFTFGPSSLSVPVYWSGGGIVPNVTNVANSRDIYSFMIFDGSSLTTSGIYGVPGGQNFL